jgi:hypothetical protein
VGKPIMIQEGDDRRIEKLRKKLGIKTKVQVLRSALDLLERETERVERIARWKRAASQVAESSREVLSDFRSHSRLRRSE